MGLVELRNLPESHRLYIFDVNFARDSYEYNLLATTLEKNNQVRIFFKTSMFH